jgi:hypothetical protein
MHNQKFVKKSSHLYYTKEKLKRRLGINDSTIDQVYGSEKRFIPEFKLHGCIS